MTIFNLSLSLLGLFAQDAPAAPAPAGGGFQFMLIMFMVLIAMYLFFILPKKRQEKQFQQMLSNLKKNDRVLMYCGIMGTIDSIDRDTGRVVIEVDEHSRTKITFSINAIYALIPDSDKNEKTE